MKKRILALAVALTMAMPMTAMAERKPIPLGQSIWTNGGYGQAGEFQYNVVDAETFFNTKNQWGISVPATERAALEKVVPADYDVYYVNKVTGEYHGGGHLVNYGIVIDGQEFRKFGPEAGAVSADGVWAYHTDTPAGFVPAVHGHRWSITIDGVTYDSVMQLTFMTGGTVWVAPKAASSVRALYAGITSGNVSAAMNYTDMGSPDWDNAYYIDLKTGTNTASTQPQSSGATPEWRQDAQGWRVQRPDGSYLQGEWYLYNNQWYYLGADGYMLVSTTTPDGYTVNADGVWVQ